MAETRDEGSMERASRRQMIMVDFLLTELEMVTNLVTTLAEKDMVDSAWDLFTSRGMDRDVAQVILEGEIEDAMRSEPMSEFLEGKVEAVVEEIEMKEEDTADRVTEDMAKELEDSPKPNMKKKNQTKKEKFEAATKSTKKITEWLIPPNVQKARKMTMSWRTKAMSASLILELIKKVEAEAASRWMVGVIVTRTWYNLQHDRIWKIMVEDRKLMMMTVRSIKKNREEKKNFVK